jgi:hypothetical protein
LQTGIDPSRNPSRSQAADDLHAHLKHSV